MRRAPAHLGFPTAAHSLAPQKGAVTSLPQILTRRRKLAGFCIVNPQLMTNVPPQQMLGWQAVIAGYLQNARIG
jgi:hypothetical protein